jgi:hypothetical protein
VLLLGLLAWVLLGAELTDGTDDSTTPDEDAVDRT